MVKKSIKELDYPEYGSEKNISFDIDLSYIENKNVPKNITDTIKKNLKTINYYKYSQDKDLINLISKKVSIDGSYILLTSGCDGALKHISETFLEKNDKVLIPVPSFPRYEFHAKVMEAEPHFLYFNDYPYEFDLDKIYREAKKIKPKLIFIANPNNPTGHFISKDKIEKFLKRINSIVVLDEALAEYTGVSCIDLVKKYNNLIVTRSFSKLYGLAGLRIGYIVASPSKAKEIAKTVSPFELSSLSIEAAKVVLNNKDFVKDTIKSTREGLKFIKNNLKLRHTNSSSSVVLVCHNSVDVYSYLEKNKIAVVSGKYFRGIESSRCVRVAVGVEKDLDILTKVLNKLK